MKVDTLLNLWQHSKFMIYKIFLILVIMFTTLNAYESEDKLKAVIIGKVAKYITWQDKNSENFTITILKNKNGDLFDKLYNGKKIAKKPVKIIYIDDVKELGETNVLYVSKNSSKDLNRILENINGKNILLVGDIRGFAEKGGTMQIYFASQKIKLRINLQSAKKDNLKFKSTLLRIADVIKKG